MKDDVLYADDQWLLDKASVISERNDPEEITEAAIEALVPHSYVVPDPARAAAVAARFGQLNAPRGAGISGRLGKHYAWKHAETLLPDEVPA